MPSPTTSPTDPVRAPPWTFLGATRDAERHARRVGAGAQGSVNASDQHLAKADAPALKDTRVAQRYHRLSASHPCSALNPPPSLTCRPASGDSRLHPQRCAFVVLSAAALVLGPAGVRPPRACCDNRTGQDQRARVWRARSVCGVPLSPASCALAISWAHGESRAGGRSRFIHHVRQRRALCFD